MVRNLMTPRSPTTKVRHPVSVSVRFPEIFREQLVRLGLCVMMVALSTLLTSCLGVRPMRVKLPLDQSVTFSAAQYKSGRPLNVGAVQWSAENLGTHRPARVTPDGVFTARLPGLY